MKRIAVSMRVVDASNYTESRDTLSQDWCNFFDSLGCIPILVPNKLSSVETFVEELSIDGVILTGGNTVGLQGDMAPPDEVKPERDKTESILIYIAIQKSLPILGVCRGMQMINRYFGGTITRNLSLKTDLQDNHVANNHNILLHSGEWKKMAGSEQLLVNSFHDDGLLKHDLATNLRPVATSLDGLVIEAVDIPGQAVTGIEWHVERSSPSSEFDRALIKSIFGI